MSLKGLSNRFRSWRYGGITGLNYVEANAKMTTIVTLPWLIGYLGCFILIPDPFLEISIILMSVIWIFYCYGIYSYAKVDATRFRPFPQSMWRFPDGGTRHFDLKIPPDGFSKECEFDDGEVGYRWELGARYQYQDKRMDFPFVFEYALVKMPTDPDGCFSFGSAGEFFHKGIAIKHPACEDIVVHVYEWIQDERGAYAPVCKLRDATVTYNEFLESFGAVTDKEMKDADAMELSFFHERNRRMMLSRHTETLEDMVSSDITDSKDFRKRVDDGMTEVRDRVKSILETEKPLLQRIKSKWYLFLVLFVLAVALLWMFGVI